MPKVCYVPKAFSLASLQVIAKANEIINDYAEQGFDLTLRQLYYQFVARGIIPNKDTEYKRLGSIINDARLAGRIDWDHITDRTRNVRSNPHWETPADIVRACSQQFRIDLWEGQEYRPEVWIEKDALVGVIEGVCRQWDVSFFSCRGYTSQSEMWGAGRRLAQQIQNGQTPLIIHLGDHDPSGLDMSRDIFDRLKLFLLHDVENVALDGPDDPDWDSFDSPVEVRRIALNWDQIQQYNPPPNPAKITDSRSDGYIRQHGRESWELDALDPVVISDLIETEIRGLLDVEVFDQKREEQLAHRDRLGKLSSNWEAVVKYLGSLNGDEGKGI